MTRRVAATPLLAGLLWCLGVAIPAAAWGQNFVDATGRTVAVPDTVHRVLPAGPPADLLLFSVAPDMLVGLVKPWSEAQKSYVPEPYRALAAVPRINRDISAADLDRLKALKPDLIVDYGDVTPAYAGTADKIQAATGIPYVLLNGTLAATPDSVRALGRLLGRTDRAEVVAHGAEGMLARVAAAVAGLAKTDRIPIFLARGDDGLQAVRPGNVTGGLPDDAGGRNVTPAGESTFLKVTAAEVGDLAPKVVLLASPAAAAGPDLPLREALPPDTRFLVEPGQPVGWVENPPSLNRLVGVVWLTGKLRPDRLRLDAAEVQAYWKTLFGFQVPEADIARLLNESN